VPGGITGCQGDINKTGHPVRGQVARPTTLFCKKLFAKSKEVKTRWANCQEWTNLAEYIK
jgi:hypothetical protein